MRVHLAFSWIAVLVLPAAAHSKPTEVPREIIEDVPYVDRVGDVDGSAPRVSKVLQDTIWIADWTFDSAGGVCDDTGWTTVDNRVLNDGQVYWNGDDARFDGTGGIVGEAAVLAGHDLCWFYPDGYDNNWYQALVIRYTGESSLSFDYLVDSEAGWDFLRVEVDSACSSLDRVDYAIDPSASGFGIRGAPLFEADGLDVSGHVESLVLTNFGASATEHCAYVAFFSDGGVSPADGSQPTTLGIAIAVDNVQLTGGTVLSEDFEAAGTMHPALTFANIKETKPFGNWARLYEHITDNDVCTENTTCAWLFTDDQTPTVAVSAGSAYGPNSFVVRNWLDNEIISPWVSLAGTEHASGTVLSWSTFGGNPFGQSRLFLTPNVRVRRAIDNTDTPEPGDSVPCIHLTGTGNLYNSNRFYWETRTADESALFRWGSSTGATDIQVGFEVFDAQFLFGWPPPPEFNPGPGPYVDRVRLGRTVLNGPQVTVGNATTQAQDAFPTEIDPSVSSPATGEHHRPTTDRFGTCAFSMSRDIAGGIAGSPRPTLVTGDSIIVQVRDFRGAGGITSVEWYGAIVEGPHAGKAPPPWSVDPNGFFKVPPTQFSFDRWFVDLDDDYFRGGDVLYYFWLAQDALGGYGSSPRGLTAVPASVEEAEAVTDGLWEVSFLPKIDWDAGYLARVAADPHGKLEPTAEELGNSSQANCILYVNWVSGLRRSGDTNRTSFMYTLDQLGYRGHYDVYDDQGGQNNDLGGRATIEQATGYSLIVQDVGRSANLPGALPDGSDLVTAKVDQVGWYRHWLANASSSEAGSATLWLIGSRLVEFFSETTLLDIDMGVDKDIEDVLTVVNSNPDVRGQTSFTFANGSAMDFSGDAFTIQAACPDFPPYNNMVASGTAAVTHRWKDADTGIDGGGAIVMNANPAGSWNTIMQAPTWREIRESGPNSPSAEVQLLSKVLSGVLPADCLQSANPATDVGDPGDSLDGLPKVTALYRNVPNPFNPVTTIRFDLARNAHVDLRIYNAAGRLVRTLASGPMQRERHKIVWDGLDDAGTGVASGIYFYRLETDDFRDTRKMVVLR